CRSVSAALYARVRLQCAFLHTRPRVQRAPGIPCALWLEGEDKEFASLGRNRAARTRSHGGIVSRALRRMERLRNDALQTRDPGVWGWSGAGMWVPALRCTAEEALHRVRDTSGGRSSSPLYSAQAETTGW